MTDHADTIRREPAWQNEIDALRAEKQMLLAERRQAIDALREWTDWALSGIAAPVDDPVHSLTERSVELLVQLGGEKP